MATKSGNTLSLVRKIILTVLIIAAVAILTLAWPQFHWIGYVLGVVVLIGIFVPPVHSRRNPH